MKLFLNVNPKILAESIPQLPKTMIDEIDEIANNIDANIGSEVKIPKDVLDSFYIKDNLNPDIWINDKLDPKIKTNLIKIAKDFFNDLELPKKIKIKDIIFTGSLANYNWSKFSDIDLHIVIDLNQFDADPQMVEDYFFAQKSIWNEEHNITVKDFPVEVYVQDINAKLRATAIYSVLYDKWVLKPTRENFKIDKKAIKDKAEQFIYYLRDVRQYYNDKNYKKSGELAKKLKDKVRHMRNAGLENGGEFSLENLVFKVLRRTSFMDQLDSLKSKSYDNLMTIDEEKLKPSNDDGFFDFDNAKMFAKDFLKINLVKQLGEGNNGAAYLTDTGTKIKFTYSKREFQFAKEHVGKTFKHMSDIYMAEEITDGVYVIEMEYIDDLPINVKKRLQAYLEDTKNSTDEIKYKIEKIKQELGNKPNDLYTADNFGWKKGELATFDPVSENEKILDEENDRYASKRDYYVALFKATKAKELYGNDKYWQNIEDGQFVGAAIVGITGKVTISTQLAPAGDVRKNNLGLSEHSHYITFKVMAGRGIEHPDTYNTNIQPARTRGGIDAGEETSFTMQLPQGISLEDSSTVIKFSLPKPGSPASDAQIKTWVVYGDIIADFVRRNTRFASGYKNAAAADISKEKMAANPALDKHKKKKDLEMELGRRISDSEFENFLSTGSKPQRKNSSIMINPEEATKQAEKQAQLKAKYDKIKARQNK